jgi:hypothetical protein
LIYRLRLVHDDPMARSALEQVMGVTRARWQFTSPAAAPTPAVATTPLGAGRRDAWLDE